jgi:hypothetical protein
MKCKELFVLNLILATFYFCHGQDETGYTKQEIGLAQQSLEQDNASTTWVDLLNKDYRDYWEVFIGVPHHTVKGVGRVDPSSDGKKGIPLGLNKDPKGVFTVKQINNENILYVSGEIYGAFTTKQEYGNYHLKVQFKWGDKKWEPRLDRKRDSGILYHGVGEHGAFWNAWMQSQEFQVQQGDMGDYYALAKTAIDIPSSKREGEKQFTYDRGGVKNNFSSVHIGLQVHCNKGFDNEKPHGEWNTLELVSFGGTSLHVVNGKVVMALYNSRYLDHTDTMLPLVKGKIQIQSEAAAAYYKNIQIRPITEIPEKFSSQL